MLLLLYYSLCRCSLLKDFLLQVPIGENLLKDYTYKESNTEAAASFIPFDDAEICNLSPRSQVEGVNKDTNSLVAVDYTDTEKRQMHYFPAEQGNNFAILIFRVDNKLFNAFSEIP